MNSILPIRIHRENFFRTYFEQDLIPTCYPPSVEEATDLKGPDITIVNCIPPYLADKAKNLPQNYSSIQRSFRLGYLLNLKEFENANQYLKKTIGGRALKKLRRDRNRLHSIPGLEFEVYFGALERKEYESLMESLNSMIRTRFSEQPEKHTAIQQWDQYMASTYDLIINKMASLFVYKIEGKPVSIGLNFHKDGVLASSITSFDSSFQRLSMGKLMLVRKIEWCFENNYTKMDLGWGDFGYKKKLANEIYKYRTDLIYKKGNIILAVIARLIVYLLEQKYLSGKLRMRNVK